MGLPMMVHPKVFYMGLPMLGTLPNQVFYITWIASIIKNILSKQNSEESIILVQEAIQLSKKSQRQDMVIKLVMENAFNRVGLSSSISI